MPRIRSRTSLAMVAAATLALLSGTTSARGGERAAFQRVINDHADSIVIVKLVLTIKGGVFGPDGQESEVETSALMVDPKGIVLASNSELGGLPPSIKRVLTVFGGEVSIIPSNIKVLVGDDTVGLEGELFARDSELDLAWIRIASPGDRKFASLDLARSETPKLGQDLVALTRMDSYFGYAPVAEALHVAGVTTKPRKLVIPGEVLGAQFGTPIYTTDGTLVGVTIVQSPEIDITGGDPLVAAAELSDLDALPEQCILPAAEVLKATRRALESARDEDGSEAVSGD